MIVIKNFSFSYTIQSEYSKEIIWHDFSFMFLPVSNSRQEITDLSVNISGCEQYFITMDNFGNKKCFGKIAEPHRCFKATVCGKAKTGLDIFEEYTTDCLCYAFLKYQTPLTRPKDNIISLHKSLELDKLDGDYDKALCIMNAVHGVLEYVPGATEIHTEAESALAQKKGVCQDYTHIMLSLLRMERIAARYVVGLIPGEGASHAWAEVLCKGYWYGFDPTNNKLVNDEYIRVSCGRDSSDCAVIRGTFRGLAEQKQFENAVVENTNE